MKIIYRRSWILMHQGILLIHQLLDNLVQVWQTLVVWKAVADVNGAILASECSELDPNIVVAN